MPKRKRNYRWIKWFGFLILVVFAVVIIILVKNNLFGDQANNNESETSSISQQEDEAKSDENKKQTDTTIATEKAPQYEGKSPNASEALTGLITYADVVDDNLIIRVNIDQFLQTGSCTVELSRNGATYYKDSVAIIESVTTSTCDGFKIPVDKLAKGDFRIDVILKSGDKSGKIEGKAKI